MFVQTITLAALLASAQTSNQTPLDLSQAVRTTVVGEHVCSGSDWKFVTSAKARQALGQESLPTRSCRAVSLFWLPNAKVVQVKGWQHTDVFVCRTLIGTSQYSAVSLVSAFGGMVTSKLTEIDPSSLAIFNRLLNTAKYKPSEQELFDLAGLYMFIVGYSPDEGPEKISEAMILNNILGTVHLDGKTAVVELHQRTALPMTSSKDEWLLNFRYSQTAIQLISVTPKGGS